MDHRKLHTEPQQHYKCDDCGQGGAQDMTTVFLCPPCSCKRALNWKGPILATVNFTSGEIVSMR